MVQPNSGQFSPGTESNSQTTLAPSQSSSVCPQVPSSGWFEGPLLDGLENPYIYCTLLSWHG